MTELSTRMKVAASVREAVAQDKPFVHFNMHMTPEEVADQEALQFNKAQDLIIYGLGSTEDYIAQFLFFQGNDPDLCERVALSIIERVHGVIDAIDMKSARVDITSHEPTDIFTVPGWHQDRHVFTRAPHTEFKAVFSLLPTIFCDAAKNVREKINQIPDRIYQLSAIADIINADQPAIQQAPAGFGSLFKIGDGDNEDTAFHSEPNITKKRLFFSVVPSNDSDARQYRAHLIKTSIPHLRHLIKGTAAPARNSPMGRKLAAATSAQAAPVQALRR